MCRDDQETPAKFIRVRALCQPQEIPRNLREANGRRTSTQTVPSRKAPWPCIRPGVLRPDVGIRAEKIMKQLTKQACNLYHGVRPLKFSVGVLVSVEIIQHKA